MSASTLSTEAELYVAAGVIRNRQGQILIARRREDAHQGGKWEFPGGKLLPGESPYTALVRELKEELAIEVTCARPLIRVRHVYPDLKVRLEVFEVTQFQGTPTACENQPLAWVSPHELKRYDLPEADRPIAAALELPAFYPVLEHLGSKSHYRQAFFCLFEAGYRLLYLRARDLPATSYLELAEEFGDLLAQAGGCLMLRTDPPAWEKWAQKSWHRALGLHLSGNQLKVLSTRPEGARRISAACHSLEDLKKAQQMGLDFAVLSPILPTATHPHASPLGWETAQAFLEKVHIPVYLMGGLKHKDLPRARGIGAQGVAGIRLFFKPASYI
jgi:8-oxo-dGTP diphosphatase